MRISRKLRDINIVVIFGTRPEAIKLYPIIKELKKIFGVTVVSTGQHKEILDQVLFLLDIEVDYNLGVMAKHQNLTKLVTKLHRELGYILPFTRADLVIVQGDTASAMVGALEAYWAKIPVAHVEAGLRTHNIYNPFPEEVNRKIISTIAKYHFAPTPLASLNLQKERVQGKIFVTGNSGIDTLLEVSKKIKVKTEKMILITIHRRETWGKPMEEIFGAIKELAKAHQDYEFLFPCHPNPTIKRLAHKILGKCPNINISQPLHYFEMVEAMKKCYFIMTDSGGLQEEGPSLGKPVLVLRENTERPEGIIAGVNKLVGIHPKNIIKESNILLKNKDEYLKLAHALNPYGDGTAAKQIINILKRELCED